MNKIPLCVVRYLMSFMKHYLHFICCCKQFLRFEITTEIFAKQTNFKFLKITNLVLNSNLYIPETVKRLCYEKFNDNNNYKRTFIQFPESLTHLDIKKNNVMVIYNIQHLRNLKYLSTLFFTFEYIASLPKMFTRIKNNSQY